MHFFILPPSRSFLSCLFLPFLPNPLPSLPTQSTSSLFLFRKGQFPMDINKTWHIKRNSFQKKKHKWPIVIFFKVFKFIVIREIQTTFKYQFTSVRMAIIKNIDSFGKNSGGKNPFLLLVKVEIDIAIMAISLEVPQN